MAQIAKTTSMKMGIQGSLNALTRFWATQARAGKDRVVVSVALLLAAAITPSIFPDDY
jgi:hypothetical protein